MSEPITVYYDGLCGLCSKEINHYRKIAPAGRFDWADIATDATRCSELGVSQARALEVIHVRDSDGTVYTGVAAFAVMWEALPRWGWLAVVARLPLMRQFAEWLYRQFARWRFNRLGHCQLAAADERRSDGA